MPGDKYGRALYPYINNDKASLIIPPMQEFDSPGSFVRASAGETPNHIEQVLALRLARNYAQNRQLVIDYYTKYAPEVGFCAKGGTDEFASTSHWGHFGFAWGGMTLFAARKHDNELLDVMAMVWGWSLAWARLCRTPWYEIVSSGARHYEGANANQTIECNITHRWLDTGTTGRRLIKGLAKSPSWGGLYCLALFEKESPELFAEWSKFTRLPAYASNLPLPPLKNRLTVHRYSHGHFAYYYPKPVKMLQPATFAITNYSQRSVRYGVPHLHTDNWPDEAELSTLGRLLSTVHFPVAGDTK